MDPRTLVDALVRDMARLIAEVSLLQHRPVSLGHIRELLFAALVHELGQTHGKTQRVIADMFGLPLRTFQHQIKAASEAGSRDKTIWEAVYDYVRETGPVSLADVLHRFRWENDVQVRSVLRDMVDSGLAFRAGRGRSSLYQINPRPRLSLDDEGEADIHLIRVAVYLQPETTLDALMMRLGAPTGEDEIRRIEALLGRLVDEGQVQRVDGEPARYRATPYALDKGRTTALASLYDHHVAVVQLLTEKLAASREGRAGNRSGGSTYRFDLRADDDLPGDVMALVDALRARLSAMRTERAPVPESALDGRFVVYLGLVDKAAG